MSSALHCRRLTRTFFINIISLSEKLEKKPVVAIGCRVDSGLWVRRQLPTLRTHTKAPHFPRKSPLSYTHQRSSCPSIEKVFIDCLSTGATSPLEASPRTKITFHHRLGEFPQAAVTFTQNSVLRLSWFLKDTSHVVLLTAKNPKSKSVTLVHRHVRDHPPYDQRYAYGHLTSLGYCVYNRQLIRAFRWLVPRDL